MSYQICLRHRQHVENTHHLSSHQAKMSHSTYATLCCFLTVAALGFFLFGASSDSTWCYAVGGVCISPLVCIMMYACCVYPCKEQRECCYAEEGCWIYCCGYEEAAPQPEPKPKKTVGRPKPSAPPQHHEEEQLPSAPPAIVLQEVIIQT